MGFMALLNASCRTGNTEIDLNQIDTSSVLQIDSVLVTNLDTLLHFSYSRFKISSKADLDSFNSNYTAQQRRVISDINRIDVLRTWPVDSLVIPYPVFDHNFLYTPFPFQVSSIEAIDKILLVSRKIQAIGAYESGKLVYWAPTSTGKKSTPTPEGLYFTNWKARTTVSTIDSSWIMNWYYNIENIQGVSVHEFALPGFPASHACVRLKSEDAYWFYHWGQQWILDYKGHKIRAYGTPVVIYDSYDFDAEPIWKYLVQNPDTTFQNEAFLSGILSPYLEIILERQLVRDSLEITLVYEIQQLSVQ